MSACTPKQLISEVDSCVPRGSGTSAGHGGEERKGCPILCWGNAHHPSEPSLSALLVGTGPWAGRRTWLLQPGQCGKSSAAERPLLATTGSHCEATELPQKTC